MHSMAKLISIAGMVVGAVGIFFGFYFLARAPALALSIVTGTTVGIAGVLAFIRHVVFHRSDAARLGWETDQPDWMFEVGFANLAFGAMGLLTAGINLGGGDCTSHRAARLLNLPLSGGHAPWLSVFHDCRAITDPALAQCGRHALYAAMMMFFAVHALAAWKCRP